MNYHIPKPSLALTAVAGAVVLLLGWLVVGPPALWQNPPLYPNARQVQMQDYGEGRYEPSGVYILKRTAFITSDSPEQVWAFYQQRLAANDKLGPPNYSSRRADQLWHDWFIHVLIPWPEIRTLAVTTQPLSEGGTRVELLLGMDPD